MVDFFDASLVLLDARITALRADVSALRGKLLSLEISVDDAGRWSQAPFVELPWPVDATCDAPSPKGAPIG